MRTRHKWVKAPLTSEGRAIQIDIERTSLHDFFRWSTVSQLKLALFMTRNEARQLRAALDRALKEE